MLNGIRVCVATLGCKVNQYDSDAVVSELCRAGAKVVPWGETADIAVINTCTVTATADSKSRSRIRQAARLGIPVCVCGCLAEHDPDGIRAIEGVAAIVRMNDRSRIAVSIADILGIKANDFRMDGAAGCVPHERTRGFLKIQEGCGNVCTYCIIRTVRGKPSTRSEAEIMLDAKTMAGSGVKELVLSGINISSYGTDNGQDLFELLHKLSSVPGIERLRLGSLDPRFLDPSNVRQLAGIDKLCPHFHVSLQSGCALTLNRMNRGYTPQEYMRGIELLRDAFERPAVTTDVMTGFPGETSDEFSDSVDFITRVGFARLHVFPYSEREGTEAAEMPNAVPWELRRKRAAEVIRIGLKSQRSYIAQFQGDVQQVLFDQQSRSGSSGYTDRYIRVYADHASPGQTADVKLERLDGYGYTGILQC